MLVAKRLSDVPIVFPNMDDRMGKCINGPSLIKVPSWVKNPLGRYYLYFADHKGSYIRLAFADDLLGPWHVYRPGVLDVKNSLFSAEDPPPPPDNLRPFWADAQGGDYLYAHIASPDVHVDHKSKQILMYFHGLLETGDQQTRLATSDCGLNFIAEAPLLGPAYFRAFEYGDHTYAISWGGTVFRSAGWRGPFEHGHHLVPANMLPDGGELVRHVAAHVCDDQLWLFFSCIGSSPESIYLANISLTDDWQSWRPNRIEKLLGPDRNWEGARMPATTSLMGPQKGFARALLDPCIFEDETGTYLLYVGGAEFGGIGISQLQPTQIPAMCSHQVSGVTHAQTN